jgi:hypothetical protein
VGTLRPVRVLKTVVFPEPAKPTSPTFIVAVEPRRVRNREASGPTEDMGGVGGWLEGYRLSAIGYRRGYRLSPIGRVLSAYGAARGH